MYASTEVTVRNFC